VLRVYHLGHGFVYRAWLRALRIGEHPPEMIDRMIGRSLELSFAYVDAMSTHIADAYAAEKARLARRVDAARAETARALLAGTAIDVDAASRALGYELRLWHVAAVLWSEPADDADEPLARLEAAAGELAARSGASRPLLVPAGRSVLWSWYAAPKAPPEDTLRDVARPRRDGVSIAFGEPGEGARGFVDSHGQAVEARRVALVAQRAPGVGTRYVDVELVSLLAADVERARRFMARELGALAASDDATVRLRATLKVYLEEGRSLVAVARRLGIHENTVKYRVRRCEELLGRPSADRSLRLQAAILLAEIV
jgi:DNA-binding PucR family transcriptional regulator